jgi:hypothetical protein|tara:strand:- start:273 stop:569 length:297 start_codon:yes stop_codon:yes gene_type:complete
MKSYFDAVHAILKCDISGPENGPISQFSLPDGVTPPTEKAIQAKLKELEADYQKKSYARSRKQEYPDFEECIHAILDDDLTALQAKRKLIKEKYPKPK